MNRPITEYLIQVAMIVFSVVLGLYLSERIEEHKNKKEAQQILSKVKSEVSRNKRIVEYWAPYHGKVVEVLDSLRASQDFVDRFIEDESAIYSAFSRETMMGDMVSSDAWDIAKSHPLFVSLDYDQLLILSKIYNQQEFCFSTISDFIELMISTDLNSPGKAEANLQMIRNQLHEIYGRERQLMHYFDEGAEILGLDE